MATFKIYSVRKQDGTVIAHAVEANGVFIGRPLDGEPAPPDELAFITRKLEGNGAIFALLLAANGLNLFNFYAYAKKQIGEAVELVELGAVEV